MAPSSDASVGEICAICGVSSEEALHLLSMTESHSVNDAVDLFFRTQENGGAGASGGGGNVSPPPPSSSRPDHNNNTQVGAIHRRSAAAAAAAASSGAGAAGPAAGTNNPPNNIRHAPATVLGLGVHAVVVLVRFTFQLTGTVVGLAFRLPVLRTIKRVCARALAPPPTHADGAAAARAFVANFDSKFGTTHPRFIADTYTNALRQARRSNKFLVAYLHCARHPATDSFCRETMCDETLSAFLDDGFVVWGGDVDAPEAFALHNALNATTFPLLVALHLGGNAGARNGGDVVEVWRRVGPVTPAEVIQGLAEALERFGSRLDADRQAEVARDFDRQLRAEQDAEYERAAAADRARMEAAEAARKEAAEAKAKVEAEEKAKADAEAAEARRVEELATRRENAAAALPDEPAVGTESPGGAKVARILVRTPGGGRKERRFFSDASVGDLYAWVDALPTDEKVPEAFRLVTSYPRKIIDAKNSEQSLVDAMGADVVSGGQVALFIEDASE
ncbi:UBX domain-containing protein [Pseudoscourfieldia marina]